MSCRAVVDARHLAVRVQQPEVGVQLAAVVPGELGADGVQRDVQRPPVRLHLLQTSPHQNDTLVPACLEDASCVWSLGTNSRAAAASEAGKSRVQHLEGQEVAHDLGRGAAQLAAELLEIVQVCLQGGAATACLASSDSSRPATSVWTACMASGSRVYNPLILAVHNLASPALQGRSSASGNGNWVLMHTLYSVLRRISMFISSRSSDVSVSAK